MNPSRSSFLDKVLGRIERLDADGLQTVVQGLARERDFLETLFNTIEDGVLVVDAKRRISYYNRAVTELLGLQPGEAEGHPVKRYLPDLDLAKLARPGDEGEKILRHELEVDYPQRRFLRLYAAPLDSKNENESGWALILHDATEARQKTYETIESERIQTLTLLAASVAHELGNPLNALHIHLQLMEREMSKLKRQTSIETLNVSATEDEGDPVTPSDISGIIGRFEKYLDVAKGEITRLDYIVTQFLQALRPTQPNFKPASLNQAAEEVLDLLLPEIENRGVAVKSKFRRRLPNARMDSEQIKQVLVNLVKNAIQAMTQGGELTLQTGTAKDGVWITVSDTGGGIDDERIKRIFDPYFTTKKKGAGLGLMIVNRIVRDHNGLIDVSSRTGHGATFRIWIPLREPHPRLIPAQSNTDANPTPAP